MVDLNIKKFFLIKKTIFIHFYKRFLKKIKLIVRDCFKFFLNLKKYIFKLFIIYVFKIIKKILYSKLLKMVVPRYLKTKLHSQLLFYPNILNFIRFLQVFLKEPESSNKFSIIDYFLPILIEKIYFPILRLLLNRIAWQSTMLVQLRNNPHLQKTLQQLILNKNSILSQNIISFPSTLENKNELASTTTKEIYINLKKEILYYQFNKKA